MSEKDDWRWYCPDCKTKKGYSEIYDAYFCPKCDKWLESFCPEPQCRYCTKRPDKPSAEKIK